MTQEFTMTGGRNIAMKIPPHQYEATVRFYRDVVGLKPIGRQTADVSFEFGANRLWIDRVPGLSQAEIWLEIATSDASEAAKRFEAANVVRCDEIEPLPEGMQAFWISSPAAIVHLVCERSE